MKIQIRKVNGVPMGRLDEIWKDIIGYEGLYKVSNHGRILSCKRTVKRGFSYSNIPEKILSNKFNHQYEFVVLSKEGIRKNLVIHRLVAIHFIGNPENKTQVNHIDCNKRNNHYSNLEWVTRSENNIHASVNNCLPYQTPDEVALEAFRLRKEGILELRDIAKKLGINYETLKSVYYKNKKFKDGNYDKFRQRTA